MSERRDNKGRILKTGESQRKTEDTYTNIQIHLENRNLYSWKLVATDRVPAGKRDCIHSREKIAELQKDIHDGIDVVGKKMTPASFTQNRTLKDQRLGKTLKLDANILDIFEERQVRCKKY